MVRELKHLPEFTVRIDARRGVYRSVSLMRRVRAARVNHSRVAVGAFELQEVSQVDGVLEVEAFPRMALAAFEPIDVAQADGVLERSAGSHGLRASFRLVQDRVAEVAVLPDDFARAANVLPVMAAETALRIEMAYVIRVSPPVRLHLGERIGSEEAL